MSITTHLEDRGADDGGLPRFSCVDFIPCCELIIAQCSYNRYIYILKSESTLSE
jgi:hypothetical protein